MSLHDLHLLFWIALIGALNFLFNFHVARKMTI
jgi:hypothetical protein